MGCGRRRRELIGRMVRLVSGPPLILNWPPHTPLNVNTGGGAAVSVMVCIPNWLATGHASEIVARTAASSWALPASHKADAWPQLLGKRSATARRFNHS